MEAGQVGDDAACPAFGWWLWEFKRYQRGAVLIRHPRAHRNTPGTVCVLFDLLPHIPCHTVPVI